MARILIYIVTPLRDKRQYCKDIQPKEKVHYWTCIIQTNWKIMCIQKIVLSAKENINNSFLIKINKALTICWMTDQFHIKKKKKKKEK